MSCAKMPAGKIITTEKTAGGFGVCLCGVPPHVVVYQLGCDLNGKARHDRKAVPMLHFGELSPSEYIAARRPAGMPFHYRTHQKEELVIWMTG